MRLLKILQDYKAARPANHECLTQHTSLIDIEDFRDWYVSQGYDDHGDFEETASTILESLLENK